MEIENAFLKTIQHLWEHEEILIFQNKIKISKADESDCLLWLETIYDDVALDFPHSTPNFNGFSALWAAKLVYYSAYFIVHRKDNLSELPLYLNEFNEELDAGCIASADLFLKFLPEICRELQQIDHEDIVLDFLENIILSEWVFSSVGYITSQNSSQLKIILENECLKGVFVSQIIENKDGNWVRNPEVYTLVKQSLGIYQEDFWEEFELVVKQKME